MALSRESKWFLAFLALMFAGGAGLLYMVVVGVIEPFGGALSDDVEPGQPVELVVEEGESVHSVAERLREEGVIRSATSFRLAADDVELAQRLRPGEYDLETGMGTDAAMEALLAGPARPLEPAVVRFTVPEGLTVEETLQQLADQFDHLDEADFRAVLDERTEAGENTDEVLRLPDWVPEPADLVAAVDAEDVDAEDVDAEDVGEEGEPGDGDLPGVDAPVEPYEALLFPETFEVERDASALRVLQRMVDHLEQVMASIPDEQVEAAEEDLGLDRYEMLIVASLVEREVRVPEERETVAGVIHNRLAEGMRLQIDATVLYAVGEHAEIVSLADLEVASPYNTYLVDGLPPTPIAGAGVASLRAAFEPEDVPYRYYVLDPACDFSHAFAETLEEHEVNVAAFREADRCQ